MGKKRYMSKYDLLDTRNRLADTAELFRGLDLAKKGLRIADTIDAAVDMIDSEINRTSYSGQGDSFPCEARPEAVAEKLTEYAEECVHSLNKRFFLEKAAEYVSSVELSKEGITL